MKIYVADMKDFRAVGTTSQSKINKTVYELMLTFDNDEVARAPEGAALTTEDMGLINCGICSKAFSVDMKHIYILSDGGWVDVSITV